MNAVRTAGTVPSSGTAAALVGVRPPESVPLKSALHDNTTVALVPGTGLGAYEILTLIGSGGMGEVYRARDPRLGRDVAIKVLPSEVAGDHDRLARFEREAQVLTSLNHPNIAHIHGIDDSAGVPALVMELVDGPTLADRIAKGLIPLDEALPIAKQIAEALEAANEQGIIHRDLKPSYLHGHSVLSRASSRHSGGKGLRMGNDSDPGQDSARLLVQRGVPGSAGIAFRRSGAVGPRGRHGGQHSMVTRPRR